MEQQTISEHHHDALNRAIIIRGNERGQFGASDYYDIAFPDGVSPECTARYGIKFQAGAVNEAGVNGVTCEALIAVMLDRLRGFQAGPLACPENAQVISALELALFWCETRSRNRIAAGVKGTAAPIPAEPATTT